MTDLEIMQVLIKAKELGITQEQVDEFKKPKPIQMTDEELEAIVKPMSPFDDLSEEEIQYWATPYFDELQQKKEQQKQKLKEEENG